LITDRGFDRAALKRLNAFQRDLRSILRIFAPAALLLVVAPALLIPDKLFVFPGSRPLVWLAVMVLYPLLLAWPQELVFRGFFFQRYRKFFGGPQPMIFCNNSHCPNNSLLLSLASVHVAITL
jgi:CAAX protease family protein